MTRTFLSAAAAISGIVFVAGAQTPVQPKPQDTEVWQPVPPVVTPGRTNADAPSDAIVLFDGRSLSEWVSTKDASPARWTVADGIMTVLKSTGDIRTKRTFSNYQLHIEWRIPTNVTGKSQERGNSGVYLAWDNDRGYELQVLDSYDNPTYVNGQAGSVYKQYAPLVNAMRKPGEWQTYDVVWTAPTFNADGSLKTPAYVTALHNGVLVQNHVALRGVTKNTGQPDYQKHGPQSIVLLAHGDPCPPISFRNFCLRPLP